MRALVSIIFGLTPTLTLPLSTGRGEKRARRATAIGLLLVLPLVPAALAQGPQPNRILKTIDFEERALGNNEDLPMHWFKISGKGLPHYVNGALATDRAHSGQYSFRFDLNGGSLVYRYDPTQIPVLQGARYRIEVYCQTSVLPNARARLTGYFTDLDGHPLASEVQKSELYAAKTENEGWKKLSVELDADDPKAAFLAVELSLLQPALYAERTLGDRTLLPQDIHGSAWFDDVTVAQVPQVNLTTEMPGNVFRLGDTPRLTVVVNDLFTDDLQARLTLTNAVGDNVYQRNGAMDMAGSEVIGPSRKRLRIALPALAPGWYHAYLQMTSHGRDLGAQTCDFIQLADPAAPTQPDQRFGVIATDLKGDDIKELPGVLPILAAGRVKIAVWSEDFDLEDWDKPPDQNADSSGDSQTSGLDDLLASLEAEGIAPTGCLMGVPPTLAEKIGGPGWIRLLHAKPDDWQPQFAYMVSRHANHLASWQIGADYSDEFVSDVRMRRVYDLIFGQFASLMNHPDLAMPWPAWYDLGADLPATVALAIPTQVLPNQIPLYMHDLLGETNGERHNFSVAMEFLGGEYGREVRLRDMAQRVIYALAGGADRIDLPLPFSVIKSAHQNVVRPSEDFLIDRTLMRVLGGAEFKGRERLGDGVESMLFDRAGQGILALWSRAGEGGECTLSLNLGPMPMKVDLWGNATPLPRSGENVKVDVGPMPFFLVGIDPISAQIRASVGFDNPLVESSFQTHERHLVFANTTKDPITGIVRLHPPTGWSMTPSTFQFTVNPGKNFDRPVTIEFPYNSVAGDKTVTADFTLEGDGNGDFSVPLALTLGLSDVGTQSMALRNGNDILVQQMITNYSDRAIDYTAYAVYPGAARQERLINGLEPGRTIVKLYRFKNVKLVPGDTVRCGLRQLEGMRVLNDEVTIQ